jgi:dUTP pyrophosphatase
MILEYKKRKGATSPKRSNPSDAGLDVFYCPTDPNVSAAKLDPGENQLFSTGLRFGVPHGYMLQVCNRSSMGAKRSLIVGAHIIDSGYDGEVFIDLHNIGKETQFVSVGDKIAQLILVPVVHFRALETKEEDLYSEPITISERGDGALGSTDKKNFPSTAQADMADRHGLKDIIRKGWLPNGF